MKTTGTRTWIKAGMAALALTFVFAAAACGSSPERSSTGTRKAPDFVREAMQNVPDDYLVGIGMSTAKNESQAMAEAEAMARDAIANQLGNRFGASAENDPIAGMEVVNMKRDGNGAYWCVVRMPINQAAGR